MISPVSCNILTNIKYFNKNVSRRIIWSALFNIALVNEFNSKLFVPLQVGYSNSIRITFHCSVFVDEIWFNILFRYYLSLSFDFQSIFHTIITPTRKLLSIFVSKNKTSIPTLIWGLNLDLTKTIQSCYVISFNITQNAKLFKCITRISFRILCKLKRQYDA